MLQQPHLQGMSMQHQMNDESHYWVGQIRLRSHHQQHSRSPQLSAAGGEAGQDVAVLGAHDVPGAEVDVVDEDDAVRLEPALRAPGAPVARLAPERLQRGVPDLRQEVDAVLALRPRQAACITRLPCSGLATLTAVQVLALLALPPMRCGAAFLTRAESSALHLLTPRPLHVCDQARTLYCCLCNPEQQVAL